MKRSLWALTVVAGTGAIAGLLIATAAVTVTATEDDSNGLTFADPTGQVRTIDVNAFWMTTMATRMATIAIATRTSTILSSRISGRMAAGA
jgi:hypothetical protein